MIGSTRKLGWLLAASVGINLFLVGVLAARWIHPGTGGAPPGPPRLGPPERAGHQLFHAGEAFGGDRERVQEILGEHRKELRAQWRKTRAARRNVHSALEAEPFDADALEARLAELRQQTELSQRILHRALVSLAREAKPEERRRLARWAEGPPRLHRGTPAGGRSGKENLPKPQEEPTPSSSGEADPSTSD